MIAKPNFKSGVVVLGVGLGDDEGDGGGGDGVGVGDEVGEVKGVAVILGVIVGVGVGVGVDDGVGVVLIGVVVGVGVGVVLIGVGVGVGVVSGEALPPSRDMDPGATMWTVFTLSPAVILISPSGAPPVFIVITKKPSESAVTLISDVTCRFTEVAFSAALP